MNRNALLSRQGMPLGALAPYVEIRSSQAQPEASVPTDLSKKSQMATMAAQLDDFENIDDTPQSQLVSVHDIHATLLVRDRLDRDAVVIEQLAHAILTDGLQKPILLQATLNGLELIAGARRLAAYRTLLARARTEKWAQIPAFILPYGTDIADLYHRMLADNLSRRSLSDAEMAAVALAFAADPDTPETSVHQAINRLFGALSVQRRLSIREYCELMEMLGDCLWFPNGVSKSLCTAILMHSSVSPAARQDMRNALRRHPHRTAIEESALLWRCLETRDGT